jgi:hypothetical protein
MPGAVIVEAEAPSVSDQGYGRRDGASNELGGAGRSSFRSAASSATPKKRGHEFQMQDRESSPQLGPSYKVAISPDEMHERVIVEEC